MAPLRILISRPDRIGDVVLSTPLPRELKKSFPGSFIALLLRDETKDIYLNNPYVDKIIIMDEQMNLSKEMELIIKIREYKFSHAFMLLPSNKINRILALAGVAKRIGVGHKLFQFLSNTKSVYRNKYIPLRHESDYCLDFVRKLNIKPEDLSSEIHLSETERERAAAIRSEISNGKYIVGINTTSGKSAPNWETSDYNELIKLLSRNPNFKTVITDYIPPPELKDVDVTSMKKGERLRDRIINFAALDVLISASTGPMHICAGLKVPTISLFCPLTACSPLLWGPKGNTNIILLPEENYCSIKCPGDPKECTFSGEGGISPQIVYSQILDFLI